MYQSPLSNGHIYLYYGFSLVGEAGTLFGTALRSEIYSQNNSILTFVKLARRLLWVIWSNLPSLTLGLGWSSRFPRLRISGWGIRRKSSLATQQHSSYTVTQPLLHIHTYGNTHLSVHRSISENSCHIFLKQMMWSWVTIALQRWSKVPYYVFRVWWIGINFPPTSGKSWLVC